MTADAKVGLLLGLVFIGIIAFVINGLPDITGSVREKAVTETAVTAQTGSNLMIEPAVVDVARNLQERPRTIRIIEPPAETTVVLEQYAGSANNMTAAENQPASSEIASAVETVSAPQLPEADQQTPQVVQIAPQVAASQDQHEKNTSSQKYTVEEGDSLAYIAKKYYGSEEGNKRVTIQMLYEANKDVLETPDAIRVGDQLVIPQMNSTPVSPKTEAAKETPAASLLDKFKNVFTGTDKNKTPAKTAVKSETAAKTKSQPTTADKKPAAKADKPQQSKGTTEYTVQSGDYLYKIAQKKLGDGDRFVEIQKLNKDVLGDSDKLHVGMKLKLPRQ